VFQKTIAGLFQPVMFQGSEYFAKLIREATADCAALIKQLSIKLD